MAKRSLGLSEVREQACRKAARDLLGKLMVATPSEIDLEALAYKAAEKEGGLVIENGGLNTGEGRLVTSPGKGGSIRVKAGLQPGRRRFTIAHEIGHYVLHPLVPHDRQHSVQDFAIWHDASEETEANVFAGELLMPEFLFRPRCRGPVPSLAMLDVLAHDFSTSMMATAFQYVTYTNEQVAQVVSHGNKIIWFHRSKDFWPWIRMGDLHPDSAAGEVLTGKAGDTGRMVRTSAYAWLADFEDDREHDIMEDSRYLDWYERTVTLLWLKEDLND